MSVRRSLIDLSPLRTSPAFRRYWFGSTLSGFGGRLTVVAILYQAWELTGSTVAMGLLALAQGAATLVLGLVGGPLADRHDRRTLVVLATSGQTVSALLLALLSVAGSLSLWPLAGLVTLHTALGALGAPARRTFAARLLRPAELSAGMALTHIGFQASMLVGPAVGGLVVTGAGVGACYALDAATFLVALYTVWRLPSMRPTASPTGPGSPPWGRRTLAGARLARSRPVLRGALLTDLLATVTAMPVSLFPAVNDERYGGDPRNLGLFLSAIAVGGLLAGAASGRATRSPRPGVVMLVAAGVWGLGIAGFGVAQQLGIAVASLAVAGAADTLSVISRATIVQLATPDAYRGRVSAVEHVVGVAGPELGNFRGGLVAGLASGPVAVVIGGLTCLLGVAAVAVSTPSLRAFAVSDRRSRPVEVS